jgi:hypothetical protein
MLPHAGGHSAAPTRASADQVRRSVDMSFPLSFHLPLLGPSEAHWLDDLSDVGCKDSTRQHSLDDPRLSCKQQVGGLDPWRRLEEASAVA